MKLTLTKKEAAAIIAAIDSFQEALAQSDWTCDEYLKDSKRLTKVLDKIYKEQSKLKDRGGE